MSAVIFSLCAKRGLQSPDDYLAPWKWSEEEELEGSAREVRKRFEGRTRSEGLARSERTDRYSPRMPVNLTIRATDRGDERTIACSIAPKPWASTCPHRAAKQGKCKSAWRSGRRDGRSVGIAEPERHLKGNFRCLARLSGMLRRVAVRCHTMAARAHAH